MKLHGVHCDICGELGITSVGVKAESIGALRTYLEKHGWVTAHRLPKGKDYCPECAKELRESGELWP